MEGTTIEEDDLANVTHIMMSTIAVTVSIHQYGIYLILFSLRPDISELINRTIITAKSIEKNSIF